MTIDSRDVSDLADRLCFMSQFLSWRQISEEFYSGVPAGTLNRIAKSGGTYLPKDRRILRALGLIQARPKRVWLPGERKVQRKIGGMAKRTEEAVIVIRRQK
jgi:hypothetical protein